MILYLPLLILIVIGISFIIIDDIRGRRKRRKCFEIRPIRLFDVWYAEFFGNQGPDKDLAATICNALGKEIGVQATQIYPTDSFEYDFKCEGLIENGNELDGFTFWTEKFLKEKGVENIDLSKAYTVKDLINLCETAIRQVR
jgi:hypothetical protein